MEPQQQIQRQNKGEKTTTKNDFSQTSKIRVKQPDIKQKGAQNKFRNAMLKGGEESWCM